MEYLVIFFEMLKDSSMRSILRKEGVKKIALICLSIILLPFNIRADIIYFKDGMKTVCHDRAWEEDGEIKCEYNGSILTYQKKDVLRIEKIKIDKEFEKPSENSQPVSQTAPAPAKTPSEASQPKPEKKLQNLTPNKHHSKTGELQFYNPRRPRKYWTSASAKHNTFEEAIAALAKQYDRSPEWIQHHMGNTNDLDEIHQNLENSKRSAPAKIQEVDDPKTPEILFYNPRRSQKYWTSATAKHNTFEEAISALAEAYGRSQEWVQQHMGNTNNLSEIHQNLARQKSAESSE